MILLKQIRKYFINRKLSTLKTNLKNQREIFKHLGGPMVEYESRMKKKRNEVANRVAILYEKSNEDFLKKFLVHFSAIGFHMTELAPYWFKNAGLACLNKGYKKLGDDILAHSEEEDGHSSWFKQDLITLKQSAAGTLFKDSVEKILANSKAECVRFYRDTLSDIIAGQQPYTYITLKYEIERLSLDFGPEFIGYCVGELGFNVLKGLSFVKGHAIADSDHIKDDIVQIAEFLKENPDKLDQLVATGEQGLECYCRFFEEAAERSGHNNLMKLQTIETQ